jgi:integrase
VSLLKWAKRKIEGKQDAKKVFDLFAASVLAGTSHQGLRPGVYTISNLVEDFLEIYFKPRGKSLTSEKYRFERIKKKFGSIKPEDLTTLDVERWMNERRADGVFGHHDVARLKAIMNWGYNRELFPQLRVRWKALEMQKSRERSRRLDEGEEEKLGAAAPERLKPLITMALDTGLRAGTLFGLTFGMVEGDSLLIPRKLLKNKKARHDLRIPLTQRAKAIIEFRTLGKTPGKTELIFGTWGAQRRGFITLWEKTRETAGVPRGKDGKFDLHWHDLRGEFATRLHEAGVAIETISYLLDHATIEMTRRYLKVRTRSSKPAEAIKALEEFQAAFAKREEEKSPESVH